MEWNSVRGMEWDEIVCSKLMLDPPNLEHRGLQNRGRGRPGKPRCSQEAPEPSQGAPKSAQEAPKKRPRDASERPRGIQQPPTPVPKTSSPGRSFFFIFKVFFLFILHLFEAIFLRLLIDVDRFWLGLGIWDKGFQQRAPCVSVCLVA